METLRTAVIGVGAMGKNHARIYAELKNSELVAIADINAENKTLAEKLNCNFYKDYEEMLIKEKPDAVTIATPTTLHYSIGTKILQKTNALIEKPIATTLEEAFKLKETAEKNNKILAVGHIERFNPVVKYLQKWKTQHKANFLAFNIVRVGPEPNSARILDGVILDLAIHDIDVIRFLCNEEPTAINAKSSFFSNNKETHAHVWLKFNSCSASIVVNRISPRKIRHLYAILDKAFIYANYITQSLTIYDTNAELDEMFLWHPKKVVELRYKEPLKLELEHFLECITKEKKPLNDADNAIQNLKIALEAEKIGK